MEQREIKGKQDQEELERYHNLIKQIDSEDGDFFAYAKEVLEECKAAGRPVYPIQRIIHVRDFKLSFHLGKYQFPHSKALNGLKFCLGISQEARYYSQGEVPKMGSAEG